MTRLRLLRALLLLVLTGAVAWLVSENRNGEAIGLLLIGLFRERHAIAAFLFGQRARIFQSECARTEFHSIAVPGGWSATIEREGRLHTIRLEGDGAWLRALWVEVAKDLPARDLAAPMLDAMRATFTCRDERPFTANLAGVEAEGLDATLSTWRSLGQFRSVAVKLRGSAALIVCAYWGWGVPDDVIERCFSSVELVSR